MRIKDKPAARPPAGGADYLRVAFEASPLAMGIVRERRFLALNAAFERLLGYSAGELAGRSTRAVFASDAEYERVGRTYLQACQRGETAVLETQLVARDGRRIDCLFHVRAIDPRDLARGVVGIVEDITERKRVELALRESEQRFRDLTSISSDWYWEQDEKFRFTLLSPERERAGLPAAATLGRTRWELPHEGMAPETMAAHRALIEARLPFRDFEMALPAAGGELVHVSVSGVPVFDASGAFRGYRGVSRNITKRKRAEALAVAQAEKIAAQKRQLEESNRFKAEFIARMSHELRTPLNTVLGFAELIENVTSDPALAREHARAIRGAGDRLHLLVDDILALAEIEASSAPFAPEPVAPLRLAETAARSAAPLAEGRGVRLRLAVAAHLPAIAGDERKLRLALGHLLANAIKHSPPGREVTLAAHARVDAIELSVKDCGPGIAAADRDRLFQPFIQLEPVLTRSHGGSGLGLAVVARIAALHGGSARVESKPGKGSVFTLRLPALPRET